jgi:transposase
MKRYIVDLTAEERTVVHTLCHAGKVSARKLNRAHALLLADEEPPDTEIAETLHIGLSTVERIRTRFVEGGLPAALNERPRAGGKPKLDGRQTAYLVALACATPPGGRKHWTMQLLADRLVALGVVETISDETVRVTLKKGASSRG